MKRQRSCAAHGFTHFNDLCDLTKQKQTWREINRALIQEARRQGCYSRTALVDCDLTTYISKIIRSPRRKAVDFYEAVASVGIMRFLDLFGGYEGFDSWLVGEVSNRSKKGRWMGFIQSAHLLHTERTVPPKHVPLWEVFELWVESVGWDMSVLELYTEDPILELNTA